jgi:hypothetical protein
MLHLSELQKKIDEAVEEMCNIESYKNQYNHKDLCHEGHNFGNPPLESKNSYMTKPLHSHQNYKPHPGHHYIDLLHCLCMMVCLTESVLDELRSYHILLWWKLSSHVKVICHGGQKCSPDLVLLASAKNNYFVEKAEGHAPYQLSWFSVKACHRTSPILVHAGLRWIPSVICMKISLSSGSSASSPRWHCHRGYDQGT